MENNDVVDSIQKKKKKYSSVRVCVCVSVCFKRQQNSQV